MLQRPARVAVIGAGPSGLYAAAALLASGEPVGVDVLDRLPAPYGLVRYGVAPDHVKMKTVIRVLQKPFDPAHVEFLGGVQVGEGGVPLDVLRQHFHAIVHATGSSVDRALGRPWRGAGRFAGLRARSSAGTAATPTSPKSQPRSTTRASPWSVRATWPWTSRACWPRPPTRWPRPTSRTRCSTRCACSAVRDIHVLIRRGPQHVRFTPAELRQIGELAGADVLVHDDGLLAAGVEEPEDRRHAADARHAHRVVRRRAPPASRAASTCSSCAPRCGSSAPAAGSAAWSSSGTRSSTAVCVGTGETETLDVGLVVRAIGYDAEPIPGLPFDPATGTVPNEGGRVVRDGEPVPGAYVTGWIKRGPTGVIGTNKGDAVETVAALLEDLPSLPEPAHPDPAELRAALAAHGVRPVDWTAWLRLDAEEVRRGGLRGAERVKVAELAEMLDAAHGATAGP